MTGAGAKLRADKWLWYARFFKTRSLAARKISDGRVRLNGTRFVKPAQTVAAGDVLTFAQARQIRVVRVLALGTRRGPAEEAQLLYEDMSPAPDGTESPPKGSPAGRPTKRDRRAWDRLNRPTDP
ncbi:MAG: RNA-binding S4 domain-containing protein [Marinibacterium sp.]